MDDVIFEFEGKRYVVKAAAIVFSGDVVKLPDERFVKLKTSSSAPFLVTGVTLARDPGAKAVHESVRGPETEGKSTIWDARAFA